jgi:hypothetical protein
VRILFLERLKEPRIGRAADPIALGDECRAGDVADDCSHAVDPLPVKSGRGGVPPAIPTRGGVFVATIADRLRKRVPKGPTDVWMERPWT